MEAAILFFVALGIGYWISVIFSHPAKKKIKLPHFRIKNIEILPNIRIHSRTKTYHFHHWLYMSALALLIIQWSDGIQQYMMQGVTIGCAIQGLRYPDRFKLRYPKLI